MKTKEKSRYHKISEILKRVIEEDPNLIMEEKKECKEEVDKYIKNAKFYRLMPIYRHLIVSLTSTIGIILMLLVLILKLKIFG